MGARIVCALTAVAGGAILLGQMKASGFPDRDKVSLSGDLPGAGPLLGADIDIAVSRLGLSSAPNNPSDNFAYWGTSGGIRAFSMASTSCNVGNAVAQWVAGSLRLARRSRLRVRGRQHRRQRERARLD